MSSHTLPTTSTAQPSVSQRSSILHADASEQAFFALRSLFVVAPIAFGLDKFANLLTDWPTYLASWINDIIPGTAQQAMYAIGVIEVLAGLLVAIAPRWGALVVSAWLAGIIINLLTLSGFYDVALRDFGLLVAALVLARLAAARHANSLIPAHAPARSSK